MITEEQIAAALFAERAMEAALEAVGATTPADPRDAEIAALRAENARLREALEQCGAPISVSDLRNLPKAVHGIQLIARRALAGGV